MSMTRLSTALAAAAFAALVPGAASAAGGHGGEIARRTWPFAGFFGQFDQAQLQRGFQVYKDVCSACHGLNRLSFRNLAELGGPEFPEESVKALAKEWPNQIPVLNDQGESAVATKDKDGKTNGFAYVKRPAKLSDPILGPYLNDAQARAAQNGALPPDLSVIVKARNVSRDPAWYIHPLLMLGDVFKAYQEGGADYVYALLTGYHEAPEGVTVGEGMNYNAAFPGNQLAMPPPLSEGAVTYQDGTPGTVENYARDVTAFLAWASDPSLNQRKRIGWQVMLYLAITSLLLYIGKKRIWASKH